MKVRSRWSLILLLSAIAAGITAFALPGTALCLIVMLWFLLVCPGMVVVRYLNLKEAVAEWMLALALSLAIDAIVASIALYAGVWSPTGILYTLIVICVAGVIGQFIITPSGVTATRRPRFATLLLLLVLVALGVGPGTWSYRSNLYAATRTPASPRIASTMPPLDAVIVMDNVDQISTFDPQGDRFKAAQLFVSLMPGGSEVGVVGITSIPNPRRVLALQALQTSRDKALVNNALSEHSFGPADPTPVAYFTPALQMAGKMLLAGTASHRKLLLIFTDALAFSGDQNACGISPDIYHNWFCTVQSLERQGISVALVGFTIAGSAANFQAIQKFFTVQGGFVLFIVDTSNLASQLTLTYHNWLSSSPLPSGNGVRERFI